tara:strand:- start:17131 stop:18426 length:1296 start_codon:yes stop_codon:yes gene_type:complete
MFSVYSEIKVVPDFCAGEVFSSWFRRLANAHGLNAKELYSFLMPGSQLASYDLDRHSCDALIVGLSSKAQMNVDTLNQSMLRKWESCVTGSVGPREKIWWLAPAGRDARKRSFGQQLCVECIKTDQTPFYRDYWRLGFVTTCPVHGSNLLDRCECCGEPVQVLSSTQIDQAHEVCWNCAHHYGSQESAYPKNLHIARAQASLLRIVADNWAPLRGYGKLHSVVYFRLLYILMRLLISGRYAKTLREAIDMHSEALPISGKDPPRVKEVEHLNPQYRGAEIARAWWLTLEWPKRFVDVCSSAGITSRDILKGNKIYPFPLEKVAHEHLSSLLEVANADEVRAAISLLKKKEITPTRIELEKLLGKKFSCEVEGIEPGRVCARYGSSRYWKLDGVSPEIREAAKKAAKLSGDNIGSWVEDTLRTALEQRESSS